MVPDSFRSVFGTATVSVTTLAASGEPLLDLPTRDALVLLAAAYGLPMPAVVDALLIPVTTPAPPANPLLDLPTRDALVFLAKAHHLPMPAVAQALSISRQRAYQLLTRARTALEPVAASRTVVD